MQVRSFLPGDFCHLSIRFYLRIVAFCMVFIALIALAAYLQTLPSIFQTSDFLHAANLELPPGPTGELVESFVVKLSTMNPPAPLSSGREGRSRVHARSALTTGLRGPNPKKQLPLNRERNTANQKPGPLLTPVR